MKIFILDFSHACIILFYFINLQTLPVKVVEKKTNLEKIRAFGTNEEDRISGTAPEDAAISSAIVVIGQEDINKEVSIIKPLIKFATLPTLKVPNKRSSPKNVAPGNFGRNI